MREPAAVEVDVLVLGGGMAGAIAALSARAAGARVALVRRAAGATALSYFTGFITRGPILARQILEELRKSSGRS